MIRLVASRVTTLILLIAVSACSPKLDFHTFRQQQPKSILVLPPVNTTNSVRASEIYLASIANPLGEAGYYVFPPLATFKYFIDQGIPSGSEAREIPTKKLQEIFGADAALYSSIEQWGQKYSVIASEHRVSIRLSLVDLKSNHEIWSGVASAVDQNRGGNSLAEMLVGALIHSLSNNNPWTELSLARQASMSAILDRNTGLLLGQRSPNSGEDLRGKEIK